MLMVTVKHLMPQEVMEVVRVGLEGISLQCQRQLYVPLPSPQSKQVSMVLEVGVEVVALGKQTMGLMPEIKHVLQKRFGTLPGQMHVVPHRLVPQGVRLEVALEVRFNLDNLLQL